MNRAMRGRSVRFLPGQLKKAFAANIEVNEVCRRALDEELEKKTRKCPRCNQEIKTGGKHGERKSR